jgi:hypothetical protein
MQTRILKRFGFFSYSAFFLSRLSHILSWCKHEQQMKSNPFSLTHALCPIVEDGITPSSTQFKITFLFSPSSTRLLGRVLSSSSSFCTGSLSYFFLLLVVAVRENPNIKKRWSAHCRRYKRKSKGRRKKNNFLHRFIITRKIDRTSFFCDERSNDLFLNNRKKMYEKISLMLSI